MQLRADQLPAALQRGLKSLYTVYGDEPLLAQEAGDTIRAAARAAGYSERKVLTVAGAHFDWSGLLGASQAMSLFADRQLIEIRIPSGKPGKDGSEALQRYCADLSRRRGHAGATARASTASSNRAPGSPRSTRPGVTVRVRPHRPHALPQWIAQRLARAGPARAGRRRRAAHAGVLCRPRRRQPARRAPGNPEARRCCTRRRAELRADRSGGAERGPLRRLQARRSRARRPGGARTAHARRPAGRRRSRGAGALDAGRGHPRAQARARTP